MTTLEPRQHDPPLADRLREVQVGTRQDLEISRHVFRGRAAYVVRDPVTFETHSLSAADYGVFIRIGATRTLGEVFAGAVGEGLLTEDREEQFYEFVLQLHRGGFLTLPFSDAQSLYDRHCRRRALKRRSLPMSVLFLRLPLVAPDAFLDRTMAFVRPVFSRAAFVGWLVLATIALLLVIRRWDALTDPLAGVLILQNLPMLWVGLVLLKVVHEFGHAYACKHHGGVVPEMGAYMILFTPCAYVDATDSWSFPRKRDRILVCLAGMYFESVIAIVALFVWSVTSTTSVVNALAYQTMVLASVTTVGFNLNPLMRFDGYYILSDLLEVPNLRKRSTGFVVGVLKRVVLGVSSSAVEKGRHLRTVLMTYGVSAAIYRVLLVLGIGALMITRLPLVGAWIAVLFVGGFVVSIVVRTARYLLRSEETAPARGRAALVSVLLFVGLPAGVMMVPMPGHVVASGVLEHEGLRTLYARVPGFVRAVHVASGAQVEAGELLIELEDRERAALVVQEAAEVEIAALRVQAAEHRSASHAAQERQRFAFHQRSLAARRAELATLMIRADGDGTVIDGLESSDVGRFVRRGDAVASLASGEPVIRALVSEQDLGRTGGLIDQSVECRSLADPGRRRQGTIVSIAPVGTRTVEFESLTHLAGGTIAVHDGTGAADQAYFEVTIRLDEAAAIDRSGATFFVRLSGRSQPLGVEIYRRALRFRDRLRTGE